MDRILHHSVRLRCDSQRAFEMFTLNEHLQSWLTVVADVQPVVGGRYELFWDPEDRENDSTLGCKVTAIEPAKVLAFEWKGSRQHKHFMNVADPLTHVVVCFTSCDEENDPPRCTEVHLIHSGWRSTEEWEGARLGFEQAWDAAFARLRERVNHGVLPTHGRTFGSLRREQ